MWYLVATKATDLPCHVSVIQHNAQRIVFLLQPRGLRVWENNSTLSVLQYAITIQKAWVRLKSPHQSTWHVECVCPLNQVPSCNLFRLCPCVKWNYNSRLPGLLTVSCRCGTLTVICWLQTEINPGKLYYLFFLSLYMNYDHFQECEMRSLLL